jgi:hypothetical protein
MLSILYTLYFDLYLSTLDRIFKFTVVCFLCVKNLIEYDTERKNEVSLYLGVLSLNNTRQWSSPNFLKS